MVKTKASYEKGAIAAKDVELDLLVENISRILEDDYASAYSAEVIAEFRNPVNVGPMKDADGTGAADGLCKDTIEIDIKIREGRISACTFFTDGCGASIACASRLTRLVKGMRVDEAASVTPGDLESLLNGLPKERKHCAALAVLALRNALRDYQSRNSEDGT